MKTHMNQVFKISVLLNIILILIILVFAYYTNRNGGEFEDFENQISVLEKNNQDLRDEIVGKDIQIEELEERLSEMKNKIATTLENIKESMQDRDSYMDEDIEETLDELEEFNDVDE